MPGTSDHAGNAPSIILTTRVVGVRMIFLPLYYTNNFSLTPLLCKRKIQERHSVLVAYATLTTIPVVLLQKFLNFRQINYYNHIVRTRSKCYDSNATFQPQVPFFSG